LPSPTTHLLPFSFSFFSYTAHTMSQEDHPAPVPTDPNEKMPEWLGEHPYCWKVDDEKLEGFKQEYENSCYCGAGTSLLFTYSSQGRGQVKRREGEKGRTDGEADRGIWSWPTGKADLIVRPSRLTSCSRLRLLIRASRCQGMSSPTSQPDDRRIEERTRAKDG
jgi:hypothetical protein